LAIIARGACDGFMHSSVTVFEQSGIGWASELSTAACAIVVPPIASVVPSSAVFIASFIVSPFFVGNGDFPGTGLFNRCPA
jgi:hypothetical protein